MLLLFKLLSTLFLSIFFYYGYDMKKRSDWRNLAPSKTTIIMKLSALALAVLILVTLFLTQELYTLDIVATTLFGLGALLVFLAKTELEKHGAFTWTGYALKEPKLVTSGIYSYIRHPLYMGVYLSEIGGALVVFKRVASAFPEYALIINVTILVALVYAMIFNSILAGKETDNLENIFKDDYRAYRKKVHAFIPFLRS